MSHPSLFELWHFVEHGDDAPGFASHVSACDACAGALSRLARRSVETSGRGSELELGLELPRRSAVVAVMVAVAACLAVVVARPLPAQARPWTSAEGVHGVSLPQLEEPTSLPWAADGGERGVGSQ